MNEFAPQTRLMVGSRQGGMVLQKVFRQLRFSMIFIALSMVILVVAFGFYSKKNQQDLFMKDAQISALINEVGEVKVQNEQLYQYLEQQNAQMLEIVKNATVSHATAPSDPSSNPDLAINGLLNFFAEQKELLQSNLGQNIGMIPPKQKGFVNVLLLGVHSALTDTIMLASVNEAQHKVTFVSIPRDLFYNGRKINELYHRYGIEELKKAIEEVSGIFIDKYVVVDMQSFVKVIDMVGGIYLDVPKDLRDTLYPGPRKNYITVTFSKGFQHMDGEKALKYARSRESTSDFDRSLRQQQVLSALKARVKELQLSANLTSFLRVYDAVKTDIKTDITPFDAVIYLKNYFEFDLSRGHVINTQNYLYSTISSGGQYILLPKKKGFAEIQKYIQDLVL